MRSALLSCILLAACVSLLAEEPAYRLEHDPLREVVCTNTVSQTLTGATVKEWMFFQLQPPASGRQHVTLTVEPGAGLGSGEQGADDGPGRYGLVWFDKVFANLEKDARCAYALTYKGAIHETRLVRLKEGEKAPAVRPLSPREEKLYTERTDVYDYDSGGVRQWLDSAGLHRKPGERDLDFARRVFLSMRTTFEWNSNFAKNAKASDVARDRKAVCAGLSDAYCAALRANGVPARVLSLLAANADMKTETNSEGHANNEFFAQGIGWVPADLTGGCSNKDDEAAALSYFGHDAGQYLILFDGDTDLVVDTVRFGSKTAAPADTAFRASFAERVEDEVKGRFWALQWCCQGQYSANWKDEWVVRTTPDPKAREHISAEGEPPRPGFPAFFLIWHDDAGWHVHTATNDKQEHEFQIRVVPEYGSIRRFRLVGTERDDRRQDQPYLALGYKRAEPHGVDFTPSPGTRGLRFFLILDHKTQCDTPWIFIGKGGDQPLQTPFVLVPPRSSDH